MRIFQVSGYCWNNLCKKEPQPPSHPNIIVKESNIDIGKQELRELLWPTTPLQKCLKFLRLYEIILTKLNARMNGPPASLLTSVPDMKKEKSISFQGNNSRKWWNCTIPIVFTQRERPVNEWISLHDYQKILREFRDQAAYGNPCTARRCLEIANMAIHKLEKTRK